MTSAREKGASYEREVEKALNQAGYLTSRAPGTTKFRKKVDLFGIFDIVAVHADSTMPEWIQVCTEAGASDHRRKMESVLKDFPPLHNIRMNGYLAIRYPGGMWRWQRWDALGKWIEVHTFRNLDLKRKEMT